MMSFFPHFLASCFVLLRYNTTYRELAALSVFFVICVSFYGKQQRATINTTVDKFSLVPIWLYYEAITQKG